MNLLVELAFSFLRRRLIDILVLVDSYKVVKLSIRLSAYSGFPSKLLVHPLLPSQVVLGEAHIYI